MLKIFNTQLSGIFSKIEAQEEDIHMASRLLAQALVGEGKVFIKGFGDLRFLEEFMTESNESLFGAERYITEAAMDSTDRVLLMAEYYDEAVKEYVEDLNNKNIEYVLVCNQHPDIETMHFINLSTPRAIVPTEDFDRIITPHAMAMNYIYYIMYAEMKSLLADD